MGTQRPFVKEKFGVNIQFGADCQFDSNLTCSGVNWVSQAHTEYLAGGLSGAWEEVQGDSKKTIFQSSHVRNTWRASALSWSQSKRKVWKTGVRAESHTLIKKEGRNSNIEGNWKCKNSLLEIEELQWDQKWKWSQEYEHVLQLWVKLKVKKWKQKWKCGSGRNKRGIKSKSEPVRGKS